jgi:hypothetical protein
MRRASRAPECVGKHHSALRAVRPVHAGRSGVAVVGFLAPHMLLFSEFCRTHIWQILTCCRAVRSRQHALNLHLRDVITACLDSRQVPTCIPGSCHAAAQVPFDIQRARGHENMLICMR